MRTLTIKMDAELSQMIETYARRERMTKSDAVRKILRDYLSTYFTSRGVRVEKGDPIVYHRYCCDMCKAEFDSYTGIAYHLWYDHGIRKQFSKYYTLDKKS